LLGVWAMGERGIRADFTARNLAPQAGHVFGTDAMGRDMLARALHGLALSLRLGLLTAGLSVLLASLIAMLSGLGRRADALACFVTDAMLAMPHLLLLMLLSFAMGGPISKPPGRWDADGLISSGTISCRICGRKFRWALC
jgi:peptide/nickel transport system permease protein